MEKGDAIGISVSSTFAPGDTLEVILVEPDGTCLPAKRSDHLKLSVMDGGGSRVEELGSGTKVTIPVDLNERLP